MSHSSPTMFSFYPAPPFTSTPPNTPKEEQVLTWAQIAQDMANTKPRLEQIANKARFQILSVEIKQTIFRELGFYDCKSRSPLACDKPARVDFYGACFLLACHHSRNRQLEFKLTFKCFSAVLAARIGTELSRPVTANSVRNSF